MNNNTLIDKIKKAFEQYNMMSSHKLTIALSGGADSVALLFAMSELRQGLGLSVCACHVNHKLRGAESDNDEAFVRDLCKSLGVTLNVCSIDVKSNRKKHQSIEEAAREARYEFFEEFCHDGEIATAHTATDNAETVILNLLRGTGLKGLCGIPPVRGKIIRPLILCERQDVEEFCKIRSLSYVTDSTNLSEEFTRNKIRLSLMPIIKQINPSFDNSVSKMCEILRDDSDFLDEKASDCGDYRVKYLKSLEKPLLTRIIIALLSNNNISPSNIRISQIIEIIKLGRGKINLEKHKFAVIEDENLKIVTIMQNYR
ncbi:MAG: tRNA lysidine(34) synthetase TilS [Oscillospiraceae bacterium]|nr:tRNA lysidine(34) synthetase TilS [Oscillospiraceae bacterium]